MRVVCTVLMGVVLAAAEIFTDSAVISIVRELKERYYLSCTTLLYHAVEEGISHRAFRIGKTLMTAINSHGVVTVKSIKSYLRTPDAGRQYGECTSFFYLILADEEDISEAVAENVPMEGTAWLVYLAENTSIPEFYMNVNAAFNADMFAAQSSPEGHIKLYDVYRITMQHPIRVHPYGQWSEVGGLQSSVSVSFYSRRRNLEGIKLKVVLKHSPPNHVVARSGSSMRLRGIFGSIWRDMEKRLNFSSSYHMANESGILQPGNRWSGMLGMMLQDRMDVGLGGVSMSPERCAVFHCLRPIVVTRNQLYFKKTRERLNWSAVLKPFHKETWMMIILWFVLTSACLNVGFRVCRSYDLEQAEVNFDFFNSLATIYGALCQQGSSTSPGSLSCRIIFFISYSVASILFTVYSASLTSFLAARQPYRPFENWEQLLQDGSYNLQPLRNSATYMFFANSTNVFTRRVYRELISKIPARELPNDKYEALHRVCRHDKVIYIGTEFETKKVVGDINRQGECEVISLENPLNRVYKTILLSKDTPFKDLFNNHLDMLNGNGFLQRLIKKAWAEMNVAEEKSFVGVGITQVVQMYAILLVGMFASSTFLIAEFILGAARRQHGKKKLA